MQEKQTSSHHTLEPLSAAAGNIPNGLYRHYKGKFYEVLAIARIEETLEEVVVYRSIENPKQIWIRPVHLFCQKVVYQNQDSERFVLIKKYEESHL